MTHWIASSALGVVLTLRYRPVCAAVALAPDCAAKRLFCRAMDQAFREQEHTRRIALTYEIGAALRNGG